MGILALMRQLIELLLPKGDPNGPKLEDLIAALVAQQVRTLMVCQQISTDLQLLLERQGQATKRGREIAGLPREGTVADALMMKRADGHAMLVGGDREQVVAKIADLYIARRDILLGSGSKRGIAVSAPTNDNAAEISQTIRERLEERGEIYGRKRV